MPTVIHDLIPSSRTVTAASGKQYKLPRPTIALRLALVEFSERAEALADGLAAGDPQAVRDLSEAMIELLVRWLGKLQPDVTAEEVAENFDVSDIPVIIETINSFEQEIQQKSPPASGAAATRSHPKQAAGARTAAKP